jgi:signal peptidase I
LEQPAILQIWHHSEVIIKRAVKRWLGVFVLLIALKTFLFEPFYIPSSSMEEAILPGDYLLVDKTAFGLQTPSWVGIPFTSVGTYIPYLKFHSKDQPERNEIVVFKYPLNQDFTFIKRCIGLPGDSIQASSPERVYVPRKGDTLVLNADNFRQNFALYYHEKMLRLNLPLHADPMTSDLIRNLHKQITAAPIELPLKHDYYYVLGDNRNNSEDSRYWGFLPEYLLIGKPAAILFSHEMNSGFIPNLRWNRLGLVPN